MSDYHVFGWRVRSDLPLGELLPWHGDDRAPDLLIDIGVVPPVDPHLPGFSPAIQFQPDGVRVEIPAVAVFWVEAAGRRVTVQPVLPVEAPDIRVFLLGTVLAILCFQRGLLPLHASAVDVGGRVLLLSGQSGAGKSTLAAAFAARGYRLLSDDLCALETGGAQALPKVLPAFPRLKLWADSAARLQVAVDGLERSREELEKYHVPVADTLFQTDPLPPAQIVLLRPGRPEQGRVRVLSGSEALRRYDLIHRWRLGLGLGRQAMMFKAMARLMETTPVAEIVRGDDFADLPALVDDVLALMDVPRR